MNTNILDQIRAAEKKISDIFSNEYNFSIPPYQRPYAWDTVQAGELLTDLREASNGSDLSNRVYFLGSVVLVKEPGNPLSRIVDGQQRLTTLTILLSVIRDLTSDARQKIQRGKYIKQAENRDERRPARLRLQLRQKDQPFFEVTIQTEGATLNLPPSNGLDDSQVRIVENATYFRQELEEISETERDNLISFILTQCYIVFVEVPDDSAARRIFTVLNARGLELIPTDILKADLLERARERTSQQLETELSDRWEDIETGLGRDRFVDLFTHMRMIYQREKPRSALEDGFPAFVHPFRGDPTTFVRDTLDPFANAMSILQDNSEIALRFGAKTASLVRTLGQLDNKDWEPPMLLCLKQHLDGKQIDMLQFVAKFERLAYFLFVTRADVNARMLRYGKVLNEIDPRDGKNARSSGLDLSQDEIFLFFDALDGPIYLKSRVVKPLLLRLDLALSDGIAVYDFPTITVEHVMPQTIDQGSQWDSWFPDSEEHSYWLHRLGNLILLSHRKNVRASNFDFQRKKSEYFVRNDLCAFLLTRQVLDLSNWNTDVLRTRQKALMNTLAKDWELEEELDNWRIQNASSV